MDEKDRNWRQRAKWEVKFHIPERRDNFLGPSLLLAKERNVFLSEECVEWGGSLSPVCSISPCCAVFLVDGRDTLWQKIAKKDLTDYPWFTPDSKEHTGRLWVLHGAREMSLDWEVLSWCQYVLACTIILMDHREAYILFLLVFKGNITGEEGSL